MNTRNPKPESDTPPTVLNNDIAQRAYEIYLQNGKKCGLSLSNWLLEERDLKITTQQPDKDSGGGYHETHEGHDGFTKKTALMTA
jgi:hypothetical protein